MVGGGGERTTVLASWCVWYKDHHNKRFDISLGRIQMFQSHSNNRVSCTGQGMPFFQRRNQWCSQDCMLRRAQVGLRMYYAVKWSSARSAEIFLNYLHTLGTQEAFSRLIMHGIAYKLRRPAL